MTRKYVDCRETPSVSGCTLAMSGEEEELVRAAVQHAVDVHEHTDDEELREGVRQGLKDAPVADTTPGAFVQLIEFHTDRIDEVERMAREWADAIGADRTARWALVGADRDRPGTYMEIVEFPDYPAGMENSAHPATAEFAEKVRAVCTDEPRFVNLEVRSTTDFSA
ncbi:DUF1059 domain-containing protein [Saccharomonospora azurea]|uniref:DUF1059 domain-containing protein n=1 Tax=Saccharomonospora azurea NA-128 TaxID=882081 RepID=H8GEG6_9PSEU|nr:DUF1059 domain-containing protein [Saccharomonospora azurea]EHK83964.1 hypothetical protein SZMC14600_18719 [Saccharomonospora azurea SZMC 14600]EHY87961.1 Protein of unknown function (DUF1059) [Saccharomonospora azurea NA-128]